jgi:hypothetical protein
MLYWSVFSDEEVSVSLGYALGLQTDQTPPSMHPKGTPLERTKLRSHRDWRTSNKTRRDEMIETSKKLVSQTG